MLEETYVIYFKICPKCTDAKFPSFFLAFIFYIQGAPETIQDRLVDLPPSYVATYKKYTRQGSRVLALAFKSLPDMTVSALAIKLVDIEASSNATL